MTSKVRQVPMYVMHEDPIKPKVRALPVYLMVTEPNGLPKSIPGSTAIFNLVNEGTEKNLKPSDIVIGPPEVTTEFGCNTRILLTAVEGNDLYLTGSFYLYYNRAPMSRLELTSNWKLAGTDTSTATAFARLLTASGMVLTMNEFVDHPVIGSTLKLEASANGYFFEPGTFVNLTK